MKLLFLFFALLTWGLASAQQTLQRLPIETNDMSRAGIASRMEAIKKMDPAQVKLQVDSICKAHAILLKDEKGLPLNIVKAIAANKLLLMNGEVYYLPTGASSAKEETTKTRQDPSAELPKRTIN